MKKKTLTSAAIIISLVVLLCVSVSAIGVRPAKIELFDGGFETEFEFEVLNSNRENLSVRISAIGDDGNAVLIEEPSLNISSEETSRRVRGALKENADLRAGENLIRIYIEQFPGGGESQVGGRAGVILKLAVISPGKDYELKMYDLQTNPENEKIRITLPIQNVGMKTIPEIDARGEIVDSGQNIVYEFEQKIEGLIPSKKSKIENEWHYKDEGNYSLKLELRHNEEVYLVEEGLEVFRPEEKIFVPIEKKEDRSFIEFFLIRVLILLIIVSIIYYGRYRRWKRLCPKSR